MRMRELLSATALAGVLVAVPTAAFAQTAPQNAPASANPGQTGPNDAEPVEEVLVTGSRIRIPNAESIVPIRTIEGEELFQQGQNNLGDTLNDLPGLRSTFAQQNPGAGVGITGLNLLDLRGLGTARTLVLVNGRRHVAADILNNAASPDVNTISNDLIQRVDVVTGGNSAVYGSDAIAGVVNFVLKKDFEGLQVRGNAAISEAGYGANQFVSAIAGKNFADGRGNVTIQAEYAFQQQTFARDIPFLRQQDGFVTVDADSPGLPQASDGFPDNIFLRDIRSATIHRYGLAVVPQQTATAACGIGTLANNGAPNTAGTPYGCNYIFGTDGSLQLQNGTRVGTGPGGTFIGGNGQNGREDLQLSIFPLSKRFNANLLAHYSFSDAFELFFEGKYVITEAVGNQLGPTFINNTTGSLGNDARINPRLDNPFLSTAARTTIANAYTASNCGFALGAGIAAGNCQVGNAAAQAARATAIANGSFRFLFGRNLTDAPNREEVFNRTTYRFVVGARGQFWNDWNYEVSFNYGRFEETTVARGFVDRQRFLLSLDAGRNPVTGAIQCRSQFDPASATGAPGLSGTAADPAKLASDIAACVPYNVFGSSNNSAAVNYFSALFRNRSSIEQIDVMGFVGGDTSTFFNLPGGPISFAFGGEYRREKAFNDSDSAADTGLSNFVFLGDVNAQPFEVREGYAEVRLPILKDVPFFHQLNLNGAARISDYNGAAGTVFTYNGGFDWAPVRDLRFRGSYGRSVRAPNVSETSFPNVPNFANGFVDPCNPNAIANGTAARVTNCQGQLSAAQLANLPLAGYSLGVISGSNPNLRVEESDSFTLGVVAQPRWIPGLTIGVDYYDISVSNVIVSLGAQAIVNSCYDSPGLSSPLCNAFQRNLGTTNGPTGELPGQILFNTTIQGPQNFARRLARGIDAQVNYNHSFSSKSSINARFVYTHVLTRSNFENPNIPNTENIIAGELGDPVDEFNFDASLKLDRITFSYGFRFIGPQLTSTFENFFPNNAGVTGQTGLPLNSDVVNVISYPAITYHDFRLDFRVGGTNTRSLNLTLGVDNLFDQNPPLGLAGTGTGAIYSVRGRNFFAGFRAKF
ncbi:MAG: TonB-dependent receptor [Sphingobium sp.]|nr:TonB-dependent receptor [Sphingobium sp.]